MKPFLKWTRPFKRIYPYNNKEIPIYLIKNHLKYKECINLIKNNNSQPYNKRVSNEYDIKCESLSNGKSYYSSIEEIHSSFSFSGEEETNCVVEDYINHVRGQKKNSNINKQNINANENKAKEIRINKNSKIELNKVNENENNNNNPKNEKLEINNKINKKKFINEELYPLVNQHFNINPINLNTIKEFVILIFSYIFI